MVLLKQIVKKMKDRTEDEAIDALITFGKSVGPDVISFFVRVMMQQIK